MMKFRTATEPLRHQGMISHRTPLMLVGSCFTTSVGARLAADGFLTSTNPFGTVYNPASIAQTFMRITTGHPFDEDDAFLSDGLYHSFASHSSMSAPDMDTFLKNHNEALDSARAFLKEARIVILTLGTSMVFCRVDNGVVVANCHKLPQSAFTRRRLSVRECTACLKQTVRSIRAVAPEATVILTVSPIRHAADGLHGNTLSKATLHLAIEETLAQTDNTLYFPAFEALVDDLRDYRFYAADMRHPSDVAVDYIYSLFADSFFDHRTKDTAARFADLGKRLAHRPLTANEKAVDDFNTATHALAGRLAEEFPYLKKSIDQLTKQ